MLSLPPKFQQAVDARNFEPVITAEITTDILDAPPAQQTQVATNVNNTNPKNVELNYPDPTATAPQVYTGFNNPVRQTIFHNNGSNFPAQTFTLGDDIQQASSLKKMSIPLARSNQNILAGQVQLKATIVGADANGQFRNHATGQTGQAAFSSERSSATIDYTALPLNTGTTPALTGFDFTSADLLPGNQYICFIQVLVVDPALPPNETAFVSWYGTEAIRQDGEGIYFVRMNHNITPVVSTENLRANFSATRTFAMQLDFATYDLTPTPQLDVQIDMQGTPLADGAWSIIDRHVSMVDPVSGALQKTGIVYHAWAGDSLGAKTIDLGVIVDGDAITVFKQFYVVECVFSATPNGLRTPSLEKINAVFPGVSGGVAQTFIISSAPLPFSDAPALKNVSSLATRLNPRSQITARGKVNLEIMMLPEVERIVTTAHLKNLPVEIRVGHRPTATSKADLLLFYTGKIQDYGMEENLVTLRIEDESKNLSVKVPMPQVGQGGSTTIRRSYDRLSLVETLSQLITAEARIHGRYVLKSTFDDHETYLKAGDAMTQWITNRILSEAAEAGKLASQILVLIGAYMMTLEDGKLRLIRFPRSGPSLDTWDKDVFAIGNEQAMGATETVINRFLVFYGSPQADPDKPASLYMLDEADAQDAWSPGSDRFISDTIVRTSFLGDEPNYHGLAIARAIAKRESTAHINGLVTHKCRTTGFGRIKFQVGDFIDLDTKVFLKKGELGASPKQFMIISKDPKPFEGYIDWELLEVVDVNRPPTAAFTVDVDSGLPDLTVNFTDTSTDSDGTIITWEWDFDFDGANFTVDSTLQNPSHVYDSTAVGAKTVRLRVTDDNGGIGEFDKTIRVLGAPTAVIDASVSAPNQQLSIILSSASFGNTGSIVKEEWDRSYDGLTFNADDTAASIVVDLFATETGTVVALRVTDEDGLTDITTKVIPPKVEVVSQYFTNFFEQTNPKNFALFDVVWNGTIFCAVGNADGTDAYIVTSPDGITWTERVNPKNFGLNRIAWNGTIFCAVGDPDGTDAYIITSPDGITWTERVNPKNQTVFDVVWNGTIFCAVGNADGTDAYIVTSPDGITWTERTNPKNFRLGGVTWNGTIFCAVGNADGTDAYIITSTDGISWTERENPKDKELLDIAWSGGIFCAVGTSDGTDAYIITSPDGITWTERANPKNGTLTAIDWNGSIFCAVGVVASKAYIITSSDGITWTEKIHTHLVDLLGIAWNGTIFCAVGNVDGTDAFIIRSVPYLKKINPLSNTQLTAYYANWTEQVNPKTAGLSAVAWNGSIFCAVGNADGVDAYILTSFGGFNWTEQANPKNFSLADIAWNGTIFCAVGDPDGTDAYIITSPDGITWTERANPKNFRLERIVWNGTIFCAVGSADGTDAYIVTSPDGITWTERTNPKNVTLYGVSWSGTIFCAVGAIDVTDSYLITSTDGITWTERSHPKNLTLFDVEWNGTIFCAVGIADSTDTYIITSPDGVAWTEQAAPKAHTLFSIVWSGTHFCAVGEAPSPTTTIDGAYLMTSPDGISWTIHPNVKAVSLNGVGWNGLRFCAIGISDGSDSYILLSFSVG